ncbi:MAG TPA: RNA polymerase sigma factor [Gammaproteobacteria bacterium]|nr:RNA polymerase sigma factor [Gammaproteobacteria bacterium]|tara:strand:- start:1731 stop:2309 length:579 start_codon:yes stop_codon:yes gene_type:complete
MRHGEGYTAYDLFQDDARVQEKPELDRFLASVERSAFRMADIATRNKDDALDIVQDTMTKLVEKYAHKPSDEWRPLFYRILQSRITDFHRRSGRTNRIFSWFGSEDDEEEVYVGVDEAGPVELLAERLTLEKLTTCLELLPVRQQQAFLLRAWEGFSVIETAKIMKCSEGSVKTHLSRATNALRNSVEEDDD